MAKVGFSKNTVADSVKARQEDHKYVDAQAFGIEDPATKLIHMVGGSFFNEPQYYNTDGKNSKGLTENAQELIATAEALGNSDSPEDLLIIANWLRSDLNFRSTPSVILAIASALEKTRPYVRKYSSEVIQRVDEIRQVFAAYNHLYNYDEAKKRKSGLPHSLAKGLRDAFLKFREKDFLKYDTSERPTFGDVALMLRERKRLSKPIFEYLVNHKIINPEATPVFANRAKLNAKTEFDAEARELAVKSFATWENLISQFGSNKELWEFLVGSKLLGYMALLRNLRNMEQAGISETHWEKVYKRLSTERGHRQMPFRFLSARQNVTGQYAIAGVDMAMEGTLDNVPDLPGKSFLMVDASGSMDDPVSAKSTMTKKLAGYALAAIMAKKCGPRATIAVFGTHMKIVPFSAADSIMAIVERMYKAGVECYHSTHTYLAIEWLLGMKGNYSTSGGSGWGSTGHILSPVPDSPVKVDRIAVFSDMCVYGQGNVGQHLAQYRTQVSRDAKFFSVNIGGYGQSAVDPLDKNTLLLSGFNESLFTLFREFEGLQEAAKQESGKERELPSIELLRERFKVE